MWHLSFLHITNNLLLPSAHPTERGKICRNNGNTAVVLRLTFKLIVAVFKVFTIKQPGYLRIYPKYRWGYLPFYQQGYYPFWFEFSQNFVKFRRFASRENVKPSSKYTPGIYLGKYELGGKTGKYPGKNLGKYPVRYLPGIYHSRYLPGIYLKNLTES